MQDRESPNTSDARCPLEGSMKADIFLRYNEKERLLAKTLHKSLARSVLNRAEHRSNQPQLVTINCDEQSAAAILELAQLHYGSTSRVIRSPDEKVGTVEISSSREITFIERCGSEVHWSGCRAIIANGSSCVSLPQ